MTASIKLKEAFEVQSKHGAFYTGGNVEWHNTTLFTQNTTTISLLNIETGTVTPIGEQPENDTEEDLDYIQTFTSDGTTHLVTSHKSGLLKLWNLQNELVKAWKYIHKGPIAKLSLLGQLLASGGSDGVVRVWDMEHHTCTQALRGCQGVVNLVEIDHEVIYASGDDGRVQSWDLATGEPRLVYSGHFSKVTSLVFSGGHFVTCGRDKVIILWRKGYDKALKTIPTYEAIESIASMPVKFKLPVSGGCFKSDPECVYVAGGGESGSIRVWDVTNARECFKQSNSLVSKSAEEGGLAICRLLSKDKDIAVVTVDHNIIIHHLKSFVCVKQFVGFSDEILDLVYVGPGDSHIAVATNSSDIKLYDDSSMNCQLLKGHDNIVLSLAVSKTNVNLMVSGGKDNKVRVWLLENGAMTCMGVGTRHTNSVGSVAFCNTDSSFFVTGSQDCCLKLWEVPTASGLPLNCVKTESAHDKDINCVCVSPNDKVIATASQDKTVKLWTRSLELVGTLRGHKRGVWSVRFSPVDQVVMTSSADCTIKLWSVTELSCLKTLEGHESSVLRAEFISSGMQILSAGADGLLKLFDLKSSENTGTFEQHDGKIWTLCVKSDESGFITGGSDSRLVKWKDVTEARKLERVQAEEEEVATQQKLSNYMQSGRLLKALKLALRLERPFQVLKIVQGIIREGEADGLVETIKGLRNDQKESLLKCANDWNTNSKNCQAAQLVLNALLNELQGGDFRPVGLTQTIEGALPYTERHYRRLTQLLEDLYFINYTVNCMQPHGKDV